MSEEENSTYSINLPDLKVWNVKQVYDYSKQISDYEDLQQLGSAINAARVSLFKITEKINEYDHKEKAAKLKYDRSYRRAYLASVEKTESMKRMRAELSCEDLENEFIVAEQLKNEFNRLSNSLRLELQTLQAIGNNIRQQMKME